MTTFVRTFFFLLPFLLVPWNSHAQCDDFSEGEPCDENTARENKIPANAPVIKSFTLEPTSFRRGDLVTATLVYCNALDGLAGEVFVEHEGSLAYQRRNPSPWGGTFKSTESCGTVKTVWGIQPTDVGPFDITYFIRIGNSGWASTQIRYLGVQPNQEKQVARSAPNLGPVLYTKEAFSTRLSKFSPWTGKWYYESYSGSLDLYIVVDTDATSGLRAEIKNTAGAPFPFDGPVSNLAVNDDTNELKFKNVNGVSYSLRMSEKGTLEGEVVSNPDVTVSLTPTEAVRK